MIDPEAQSNETLATSEAQNGASHVEPDADVQLAYLSDNGDGPFPQPPLVSKRESSIAKPDPYNYWREEGQSWADEYDTRKRRLIYYHIQELMLADYMQRAAPARVLEYGCGVGRHLSYLSKLPDIDVCGYDQSQTMVDNCLRWTSRQWIDEHVVVGAPVGKLPYPDKHFDIVFTSEVLIHISPADLPAVLSEIVRISKRQILHLEPSLFTRVVSSEHLGCWNHDLLSIYGKMGYPCELIPNGFELQAPYRVLLDGPAHYTWSPVLLALLRRMELDLQPTLNQAAEGNQRAAALAAELEVERSRSAALAEGQQRAAAEATAALEAERRTAAESSEQIAAERARTAALTEELAAERERALAAERERALALADLEQARREIEDLQLTLSEQQQRQSAFAGQLHTLLGEA